LVSHVPDEHFLQALRHGLPDCAGVALGLDRLLMLALGKTHIKQTQTF
jgi:lysyl-tRNA synthetase class 2